MAKHQFATFVVFLLVTACATGGGLTSKDVFSQYKEVGGLHRAILAAEQDGADVLAPDGFIKAKELLDDAVVYAQDAKKEKANSVAAQGMKMVEEMKVAMKKGRELMKEVLATRERAVDEGAPGMFTDEFEEIDDQFREASRLIESGKDTKAMEMRPALVRSYSDLELKALKKGTVEAAKAAIKQAEKSDAGEWAPITLKLAMEESRLVSSVLEADRTQTEKANAHAVRAVWLAGRAQAITELAMQFENQELTLEQIILWYQDQLSTVNEPFGGELPFDKKNDETIESFKDTVETVVKALNEARDMMNEYRTKIAAIEETRKKERGESDAIIDELLSANRKELAKLRKKYSDRLSKKAKEVAASETRELEIKQLFGQINDAFEPTEAKVELQEANVLITAKGFQFSRGGAEIEARNFGLMNKIVSAIEKFPDAKIIVSGHTDSKGSSKRNLNLSQKRAENVAKFMVELARLPKERVSSEGFGESKPVASNDTRQGREQNRRIEILISNE